MKEKAIYDGRRNAKALEFIVNQQSQSSARIDALAEAQTRNPESIRALLSIAEIQINTVSHQNHSVSRDIGTLGKATRATDGRLNALINVVEHQISEGRNRKP